MKDRLHDQRRQPLPLLAAVVVAALLIDHGRHAAPAQGALPVGTLVPT